MKQYMSLEVYNWPGDVSQLQQVRVANLAYPAARVIIAPAAGTQPVAGGSSAPSRKRYYVLEPLGVYVKRGRHDSSSASVGPTPLDDDAAPSSPAPAETPSSAATAANIPAAAASASQATRYSEAGAHVAASAAAQLSSPQRSCSVLSPAQLPITANAVTVDPSLSPVVRASGCTPGAANAITTCAPPTEVTETATGCTPAAAAAACYVPLEAVDSNSVPACGPEPSPSPSALALAGAARPLHFTAAHQRPLLPLHQPPPPPMHLYAPIADASCSTCTCNCCCAGLGARLGTSPAGQHRRTAPAAFSMAPPLDVLAPCLPETGTAAAAAATAAAAAASCLSAVRQLSLPADCWQSSSLFAAGGGSGGGCGDPREHGNTAPPPAMHNPASPARAVPRLGQTAAMPGALAGAGPMTWAMPVPMLPPLFTPSSGVPPGHLQMQAPMLNPRPAPVLVPGLNMPPMAVPVPTPMAAAPNPMSAGQMVGPMLAELTCAQIPAAPAPAWPAPVLLTTPASLPSSPPPAPLPPTVAALASEPFMTQQQLMSRHHCAQPQNGGHLLQPYPQPPQQLQLLMQQAYFSQATAGASDAVAATDFRPRRSSGGATSPGPWMSSGAPRRMSKCGGSLESAGFVVGRDGGGNGGDDEGMLPSLVDLTGFDTLE